MGKGVGPDNPCDRVWSNPFFHGVNNAVALVLTNLFF